MTETKLIFRNTTEGVTISLDADADVSPVDDPAFQLAMSVLLGLHGFSQQDADEEEDEDGVQ